MTDLDIWAENNIELPIKRALENLKVYMEGKSIIDNKDLAFLRDVVSTLLRISHVDPIEIWDDFNERMEVFKL